MAHRFAAKWNLWSSVLLGSMLLAGAAMPAHAADRKDAELALTGAHTAFEGAQRQDAARYAGADLKNASYLLVQAEDSFDRHHWMESVTDAENAKADANLAAARSRQNRAEAATAQLEATVRTLREQLNAAGG